MSVRQRYKFIPALLSLLICGLAFGQAALVSQVEGALRAGKGGAVYDLGHLLKPGGVRELQQKADQLRAGGVNVYFVTVPKGSTNASALAETVYRDLNMGTDDLLLVFDGQQVYGKSLALQGDPQAFRDAFQAARPGFRLYYAKGLAQFAQAVADRINQRRGAEAAEQDAAVRRGDLIWAAIVGVILLVIGIAAFSRVKQRIVARRAYDQRLRTAEEVFDRITINLPGAAPEAVNSEWARLDERLRQGREHRDTTTADLDQLIADLRRLDDRLTHSPDLGSQT
jgi:uncharacterized membrane protein YgcG